MSAERAPDRPQPDLPDAREWALSLRHRPLLLCCIALIAGMVAAATWRPGMLTFASVALGAGVTVGASAVLAPRMALPPLLVGCLAMGGLVHVHRTAVPPTDVSHLAGAEWLVLEGTAIRPPDDSGWGRRLRVEVEAVGAAGASLQRATGRVVARIPREPEVAVGDRVRLTGVSLELPEAAEEPGEFDYRAWLAREGVRSVATAGDVTVLGADPSLAARLTRAGMAARRRVAEAIEQRMPGADGPLYSRLLVGMVYGLEVAPLPEEVVEQFRRAGTVHLLVVSGAQVSMLAIAIIGLTGGGVRGMRWWQALSVSGAVAVLVLIVGMEASVGRAVAMFALVVVAALSSRDYDVYTALALAATVILLVDPAALGSLSFQLTFAATLGVIVFLPDEPIRRIDGSVARFPLPQIRAVLWATFGAWALTTPLLAHSVSGFALSGNMANLANVPLSFFVLVLGFAALPAALIPGLEPLLGVLCVVARGLLGLVMHVNELAANLPLPFVEGVQFGAGGVLVWYAATALVLAVGLHHRAQAELDDLLLRPHPSWPTVAGAAVVSALVCTMALAGGKPAGLEMTLLPVGAGQCAVVRTPSGATLMVDCGGGGNSAGAGREVADGVIVPWLTRRKIGRLDAVAISHWDTDHCNALGRVMSLIRADRLLVPPRLPGAQPPEELRHGTEIQAMPAALGGRLELDDGVAAHVLAPRRPLIRSARDAGNANSVVMMLSTGSVRILLPGDIGEAGATRLVRDARSAGFSLRADVLVLPHHGRNLREVGSLLDAVKPTWAIASCDRHADQYLGPEELALLARRGIRLLRTDRHGAISVLCEGERVTVSTSRGVHSVSSWVGAARR
jgi:competence protein ComEC